MSWQATTWAADARQSGKMNAAHRVVLVILANSADEDGRYAFPSVASMAVRAGVDERNVRRSLRWLEEAGLIVKGDQQATSRFKPHRRPTVYDLPINGGAQTPPQGVDGGASVVSKGGRSWYPRGGAGAPQTKQELSIEQEAAPADAATTATDPAPEPFTDGTLIAIDSPEATPEPAKPRAVEDDLTRAWWDRQDPKPIGSTAYVSSRAVVRGALKAGFTPDQVHEALKTVAPPLVGWKLENALRDPRRSPARTLDTTWMQL